MGVFTYSDEEGTASFDLRDGRVAWRQGSAGAACMAAQKQIATRRNRRRGRRAFREVLVEGTHPESDLRSAGPHRAQAPDIDGMIVIADGAAGAGNVRDVRSDGGASVRPRGARRQGGAPPTGVINRARTCRRP